MPIIIEKNETESTNDDAKDLARSGCENFTVVWAKKQTKGRGRHERTWRSNEGSVFWSIILRPNKHWHRHSDVIYIMAIAVIDTLSEFIPDTEDLKLKWPNDTMFNKRKLGGTLTEASGTYIRHSSNVLYPQPDWIVSGTGINVVPIDIDSEMIYPPTSIHEAGYLFVTRDDIIPKLLEKTLLEFDLWFKQGFEPIRERYLQRAFGLDEKIKIGTNISKKDYLEGIYRGIDENGAAILEYDDGIINKIHAGEVIKT